MIRFYLVFIYCIVLQINAVQAQTKIAKEQIEEAFILKSGGYVFGDLVSATSAIQAMTISASAGPSLFWLSVDDQKASIRTNSDLYLDPTNNGTAGAVIVPVTKMEFPDFLGDKIRFFSHSYAIGVSPFDLDLTSDRNIKFHSDTTEDLMTILGDDGDVVVKQDITAGRDVIANSAYKFATSSEGDKLLLFGTLYRIAVSANDVDFYSDENFKFHSDSTTDAMTLNADSGRLSLSGPLNLPVYTSFPGAVLGDLIYFDHTTNDSLDGAYVYSSSGWQQL